VQQNSPLESAKQREKATQQKPFRSLLPVSLSMGCSSSCFCFCFCFCSLCLAKGAASAKLAAAVAFPEWIELYVRECRPPPVARRPETVLASVPHALGFEAH